MARRKRGHPVHGWVCLDKPLEMGSTEDVAAMSRRLVSERLQTEEELGVECCYARQDKVWANDPDGAPWEWYTVIGDSPVMAKDPSCC